MPDLLAGSTVKANDTPPTVTNAQAASFTFTNTTFGIAASAGYVDCGVAFTAPTTGREMIYFAAQLDNSAAGNATDIAPVVRTGGTVGLGTTTVAADVADAIRNSGTETNRYGASLLVTGLTPGATYNVRLEHRVTAGTGTALSRRVTVAPAT